MTVNELNKIAKIYDMNISFFKTKAIELCGKTIKRGKIKIELKIREKVSNLNYVGNLLSNK
jgi:hypothetical protein